MHTYVCVCEPRRVVNCEFTVFWLLDMILGAFHVDNCHRIQRESTFTKVTVCDDHRVFVFINQSFAVLPSATVAFCLSLFWNTEQGSATSLISHWFDVLPHSLTLKCPRLAGVMASAEMVKVLVYRCYRLTL